MKNIQKLIILVIVTFLGFAIISCQEKKEKKNNTEVNIDDLENDFSSGKLIYEQQCMVCHQKDGNGNVVFPSLLNAKLLKDKEATVKQIKFGFENMPPFPDLSNQQIADLINYISNSWGNSFGKISAKEVENALK